MKNSDALAKLEQMPEDEFQTFFKGLPYRVQFCCKGRLVNWRDVLPEWYIIKEGAE